MNRLTLPPLLLLAACTQPTPPAPAPETEADRVVREALDALDGNYTPPANCYSEEQEVAAYHIVLLNPQPHGTEIYYAPQPELPILRLNLCLENTPNSCQEHDVYIRPGERRFITNTNGVYRTNSRNNWRVRAYVSEYICP